MAKQPVTREPVRPRDLTRAASAHAKQYNRTLSVMLVPILVGSYASDGIDYGGVELGQKDFLLIASALLFATIFVALNVRVKNILVLMARHEWAHFRNYHQEPFIEFETAKSELKDLREYYKLSVWDVMELLPTGSFGNTNPITTPLSRLPGLGSKMGKKILRSAVWHAHVAVLTYIPYVFAVVFAIRAYRIEGFKRFEWIWAGVLSLEAVFCLLALAAMLQIRHNWVRYLDNIAEIGVAQNTETAGDPTEAIDGQTRS